MLKWHLKEAFSHVTETRYCLFHLFNNWKMPCLFSHRADCFRRCPCLCAFYFNSNLRTRTNVFFLSLVTADISLALFVMPLEAVLLSYYPYWPLGETACNIWSSMFVALGSASVCNLCALGIDRFLAISRALRYCSDISTTVVVLLVFLWSFALLSGIISYFIWTQPNPLVCSMLTAPLEKSVLILVFDLLVPFTICVITYAKIFQISRQQARKITATQGWVCRRSLLLYTAKKWAKTLSLLVGAFGICFLPFLVYHAVDGALEEKLPNRLYVGSVVKWLAFSNSAINWALYGVLNVEYRKALVKIFNALGSRLRACRRDIGAANNTAELQTIS